MASFLIVFMLSIVFNVSQTLPISKQLIVSRQGDYHIGSRYDPFKEAINSGHVPFDDTIDSGGNGRLINPSVRAPSLLPWEDDPEISFLTDKQPETTYSTTKIKPFSSTLSPQSTQKSSTVSILPWEEDSWQLFETTVKSNSSITLITGPSTWKTPLIITETSTPPITTTKSPLTWKPPLIITVTSSSNRPSTSTTKTTTYSPLPWEEDYLDSSDNKPTQVTIDLTFDEICSEFPYFN